MAQLARRCGSAGAASGGLVGAIVGWSIPEERVKRYEEGIKKGRHPAERTSAQRRGRCVLRGFMDVERRGRRLPVSAGHQSIRSDPPGHNPGTSQSSTCPQRRFGAA